VREGEDEMEKIVRVRPDSVDLTANEGLVALLEELRACAGRVWALAVRSRRLEALPAWLGELTGLTELRVDLSYCTGLTALPAELGALTRLHEPREYAPASQKLQKFEKDPEERSRTPRLAHNRRLE
jgi:hypothetical protein